VPEALQWAGQVIKWQRSREKGQTKQPK